MTGGMTRERFDCSRGLPNFY